MKSVAHWLSWCCSMTPGVAREHVRVARALPKMPTVHAAFRDGRLENSKVREISRVVDIIDETRLCQLAPPPPPPNSPPLSPPTAPPNAAASASKPNAA